MKNEKVVDGLFKTDHTTSNFKGMSSVNFTWPIFPICHSYITLKFKRESWK